MTNDGQNDLDREFSTPMMKQYIDIKRKYPDCLLFFRLGDFYELFLNDAIVGAKALGITLTARPRGKDGDVPMAGVPYHAAESYVSKLVKLGYKVAICEQVSEPNKKGIVERSVIRIVTPGTVVKDSSLESGENNHIISLSLSKGIIGLSVADISTGKFLSAQEKFSDSYETFLVNQLMRFNPSECVLSTKLYEDKELLRVLKKLPALNIFPFENSDDYTTDAKNYLQKQFGVKSLRGFGIESKKEAIASSASLLGYLEHTQQQSVEHIKKIKSFKSDNFVILDRSTIINLELFSTLREGEKVGSLISVIDYTVSAAGGRLLKKWLTEPLKKKKQIEQRLNFVEELLFNRNMRQEVRDHLARLYDIERIVAKLSLGLGNAGDLINLKKSLLLANKVNELLVSLKSKNSQSLRETLSSQSTKVAELIEKNIKDDPKFDVHGGGLIKQGVDKKLDELRNTAGGGKGWIEDFQKKERVRTGINSLKVKFNKIFGYYIEVSKSNLDAVPDNYYRKQTLVNAERFITPEMKEYEELILTSEEVSNKLEYEIFKKTVEEVLEFTTSIQKVAHGLAQLDCIAGFAVLAQKKNYTKPKLTTDGEIKIVEGRHPVVETLVEENKFVPNDVKLNNTDHQLLLITGPNMAGKSVFMRQVALIVLLAHMGCFVPAKKAKISLVDRIFVRSGASDIIASGLSTFMVEMVETAHILNHTTDKSLIIMDEIGRGTSTYDGISIAWAVAEYLVHKNNPNAKTLFATHYHELQALTDSYPEKIKNYQVAIENKNGEPIFLHTVVEGGASHSFGVAVAKLAGVPKSVTQKSMEILSKLEGNIFRQTGKLDIDIDNMTPVEAHKYLQNLVEKYG
jgi:DNA mismatch repair protein MutS